MKILIAEDDPFFGKLLEDILTKWGYQVVATQNGNDAWQALQAADPPQLAILDWMMPGMEGVEICRRVRRAAKEPYIYLMLLTSQQRDDDLITGMEAGADDYLFKPLKVNELRVRLRAGRRIIELQDELLSAREILRDKASHDSLTGLWNHEEILRILRNELDRGEREGECVSVIMADIDHFKACNDTYGHLVGDEVLRLTVRRMDSLVRSYDFIGRFGGEEFLFVLPECCGECTVAFAERIRASICSESMDTTEGLIPVTISLGVASSGKGLQLDADSLVRAADAALYRAKENGRNRVEVAKDGERIDGSKC
jgi:two-component system, cell cycle response regulator